jgi:pimeloyl-ACP methyl ester carboxylesterase
VAAVVRAVAQDTGSAVDLLGHSYGGLCALGAARLSGAALRKLVLYEPPASPTGTGPPANTLPRLEALLAQGRPADVVTVFFRDEVGMPEPELALLRDLPAWPARVAAPHTIPRELRADQLRRALPDARLAVLPGQQHIAIDTAPELFATTVTEFLAAASVPGG